MNDDESPDIEVAGPTGTPGHSLERSHPSWADLPVEQAMARRAAAARLAAHFGGIYGAEIIERFLHSSFDEFADRSAIPFHIPVMAERFTEQRLGALAKAEGLHDHGKPAVLFLCVDDAGRSQMARGFFAHLAAEVAVAWSGGSEPAPALHLTVIDAMRELGIDITGQFPKPWTEETVRAADVVITMGGSLPIPVLSGKRYEEWLVEDPVGRDLDAVRRLRDDIERRVRKLLEELDVPLNGRSGGPG